MDLQGLKRRATVTHNKSLPEQARDAELLEVIAALERAVGLLRDVQRALSSYSMRAVTASAYAHGVQFDPKDSFDGKAMDAFLAAFPPPGGERA